MRKCTICRQEWPDGSMFCGVCGGVTEEVPASVNSVPMEDIFTPVTDDTPPKKRIPTWLLLAVAAVLLCAMLTVGFIYNWFGLFSPWGRLGRATARALKADSATITYSLEVTSDSDHSEQTGEIYLVLDEDAEEVFAYFVLEDGNERQVAAVDGDRSYNYRAEDGTVQYASVGDVDADELFDARDELLDSLKERDPDWDDILEDAGLEDYLDADEMDKFVRQLGRKYFGNRRWLKENMGYSRKGNTVTLRPDPETFLEALLEIVEDSDAFTRKGKREIGDALDEALDALDEAEADLDIEISFTTTGRYLSNIHLEVSGEVDGEEGAVELDIDISNVNKTEVEQSDIRYVRNLVEEWLEQEGIRYDECDVCSDFGELEYYDGRYLCWDCYYDRKYG